MENILREAEGNIDQYARQFLIKNWIKATRQDPLLELVKL